MLYAAMGLLMMASCSSELPVENAGESLFGTVPEGMIEFQFKLSGIKPTTSYATVQLETAEMEIEDMAVIVTQINEANQSQAKVYGVFPAIRKNGFASIVMPKNTNLGSDGDKIRFVIIANRKWTTLGYNEGTKQYSITTASTYADVEALKAFWKPKKEVSGDYPKGLPMISIVDQARPKAGDVLRIAEAKLKRPIARFDVRNNTQGALVITKIGLAHMRPQALLAKEEVYVIPLETKNEWGEITASLNEFVQSDKASAWQPGLFYAAPGLEADDLKLMVEGDLLTFNGKEHVTYVLSLKNGGKTLAIKPNMRYTIDIQKINDDITANIGFGQNGWGNGDGDGAGNDYDHTVN